MHALLTTRVATPRDIPFASASVVTFWHYNIDSDVAEEQLSLKVLTCRKPFEPLQQLDESSTTWAIASASSLIVMAW
jgi:hypothetical protein